MKNSLSNFFSSLVSSFGKKRKRSNTKRKNKNKRRKTVRNMRGG